MGSISGGHAHLDPVKSDEREPMIQGRDSRKHDTWDPGSNHRCKNDWANAKDPMTQLGKNL